MVGLHLWTKRAVDCLLSEKYKTSRKVSVKEVWGRLGMEQAPPGSGQVSKAFGAQQAFRQCSQMFNTLPLCGSSWVPYNWGYSLLLWTAHCCFGLHMQIKSHKLSPNLDDSSDYTKQTRSEGKKIPYQERKCSKNTPIKSWNHTKLEITSWGIFINY